MDEARRIYRRRAAGRGAIIASLILGWVMFLFLGALALGLAWQVAERIGDFGWHATILVGSLAVLLLAIAFELLAAAHRQALGRAPANAVATDSRSQRTAKFVQVAQKSIWKYFHQALLLVGSGGLAVGGLGMLLSGGEPSVEAGGATLFGAAMFAFTSYRVLRRLRKSATPRTIVVDRQGVHASWVTPRLLTWPSINLIHVDHDKGSRHFPEHDWIEIYGKRGNEPPKRIHRIGWGKFSRRFYFDRPLVRIEPREDFGLSPAVILDALDRFCPADVPIHDPRRIVEDDKT